MSDKGVARMSTEYGVDHFGDEERPQLVIAGDYVLTGCHQGSVHVESGQFRVDGILQGSLAVQAGATALIQGAVQGSVSVASGSGVVTIGSIEGSAHVEPGGSLTVEHGGKLAGSLVNYGYGYRPRYFRRRLTWPSRPIGGRWLYKAASGPGWC